MKYTKATNYALQIRLRFVRMCLLISKVWVISTTKICHYNAARSKPSGKSLIKYSDFYENTASMETRLRLSLLSHIGYANAPKKSAIF